MVVRFDIRTEINVTPVTAEETISASRTLASWNETRANLAKLHEDRGFQGPGAPAFAETASCPSTMGIVPAFSNDNEKGLSVVRLQVTKTYWADAPCTILTFKKTYVRSQFSPAVMTHAKELCQLSHGALEAKNFD